MLRKSLIILSVFCILVFTSTLVFATNTSNNNNSALNNVGSGVQNMVNGTRNTMQNVGNGVSNMVNDMGRGMSNMVNGIENGMSEDEGQSDMTNGTTTDGYTATRTGTTAGTTNAGSNSVIWIILAIAGVAIVALVWYYATQTNYRENDRH